jgi:hypothetical protein
MNENDENKDGVTLREKRYTIKCDCYKITT